eukprot:g5524.t1
MLLRRCLPHRIIFSYLNEAVSLAYKDGLEHVDQLHDLPSSTDDDKKRTSCSTDLIDDFVGKLVRVLRSTRRNSSGIISNTSSAASSSTDSSFANVLGWSIASVVSGEMVVAAILQLVFCAAQIASPLLLIALIQNLEDDDTSSSSSTPGWVYGLGMGCAQLIGGIANQHQLDISFRCGIQIRSALSVLIYRKAVRNRVVDQTTAVVVDDTKDSEQHGGKGRSDDISHGGGSDAGKVINLVSSDSQKFYELLPMLHLTWSAPLMIVVTLALLCYEIGWAAPIGVCTLTLMVPTNIFLAKKLARLRKEKMTYFDARVKVCTEVIGGMRVVKFNAWGQRFLETIRGLRSTEMQYVSKELHTFADFVGFLICFPMLSVAVALGSWVLLHPDESLKASTAFGTLALFTILRFPLMQVGMTFAALAQAWIALGRIASFLEAGGSCGSDRGNDDEWWDLDDVNENDGSRNAKFKTSGDDDDAIRIRGATFTYAAAAASLFRNPETTTTAATSGVELSAIAPTVSSFSAPPSECKGEDETTKAAISTSQFRLADVNLSVPRRRLTTIVGKVGSGKTSCLRGILGEIRLSKGTIDVDAFEIAYAPQMPWIVNATLRENIVMARTAKIRGEKRRRRRRRLRREDGGGRGEARILTPTKGKEEEDGGDVDEAIYAAVLDACQLRTDLKDLENGDRTVIGERGVTLSGGQKQRVSMARAAYFAATCASSKDALILFDDPLSALDSHTSKRVFNALLSNDGLLKRTTRVLVTHATYFLSSADNIVMLHHGTAESVGSFADLVKEGDAASKEEEEYTREDDDAQTPTATTSTIVAREFAALKAALRATSQDKNSDDDDDDDASSFPSHSSNENT